MDPITMTVNWIRNLFTGKEPPLQRAANAIIVIVMILIGVVMLESAMGLVTIGRLERQVNILKQLNGIASSGVGYEDQFVKLNEILADLVESLQNYEPLDVHARLLVVINGNQGTISTVLPGALGWTIIAIAALFVMKESWPVKILVFILLFLFAVFVGAILGALINFPDPSFTTAIRIIAGVASVWIIIRWTNQRNSRSKNTSDMLETSESK